MPNRRIAERTNPYRTTQVTVTVFGHTPEFVLFHFGERSPTPGLDDRVWQVRRVGIGCREW